MFQLQEKLKNNQEVELRYFKIKNKKIFPSRDFVDIKIVCSIIEKVIKKLKKEKIGIKFFNVGSGVATPIDKIVTHFGKLTKKKININYKIINKKELITTKANINKLNKFLNKNISFSLKESIKSYLS